MAQPPAMANKEFVRLPSGSRRKEVPGNEAAPGPVEMLGSYLELVEQCNEAVQKMHPRRFNKEQCQYLAEKLHGVVQTARSFFEVFRAQFNGPAGSSEDTVRCVEIFKLLVALSKQIESFVQGCCKDTWMQAAMTLTNVSEYVSSLGFNLELCRLAFGSKSHRCLTMKEVSDIHKHEVKFVKRKAAIDSENVVSEVTHGLTEKSLFSNDEKELGPYLLQRLHRVKSMTHINSAASWLSTVDEGSVLGKLVNWVVTPTTEKLGRGASGTVYKATWLGTPVAKKKFPVRNRADFDTEVRILAGLCHPNITSMFCSHAENEKHCHIIMELMDEDLYELMQRRCETRSGDAESPFSLFEAIDIMLQVGEGVHYLHSLSPSIVHRDLKSRNILVKCVAGKESESGYVHAKVADFGLSKTLDSSERFSQQSGNTGTNRWMAPEVIESAGGRNQRENPSWTEMGRHPQKSDVYSFGMVCYEILTGEEPFCNDPVGVVKRKVKKGDRPKLPDHCPRKLKELIMECWSKDPRQRPRFDVICSRLKHLKYLLMTGYSSNQDHLPAIEEPQQTEDEADTLQFLYDKQELVDSDCQTAQECLNCIVSCITSIERVCTPSLRFNHLLCERFVSKYLHHVREFLEEKRDKIGEECAPTLAALYSTVKEAKFLIRRHCTSSSTWIRAAVELVGNTSAFAEVILDLKWYLYALKIAIKASTSSCQKVVNLQRLAMAEYGDFLPSWERDCKLLRLNWDREVLLSKLKTDSSSSTEIRSLPSYLAEKLEQLDQSMHTVRGAFPALNLKAEGFFRRRELLGLGSLGRVYRIRWLGLPCSLKEIDGKTDLDDEVRMLFKVLHPNIIQLFGYFVEDGKLYLVTERMQKTLSEYIETREWRDLQKSPIFLKVALDCMLQIVKGLRYLHSQGIAHKDLKGDNILVKPSEDLNLREKGYLTVKLADFGLAKANLRNYSDASDLNVDTLVWKAPELFKLAQSTTTTSSTSSRKCKYYPFKLDVYSFGMVSYEILTGKKPFSDLSGLSPSSLFAKVKRGERPKLLPEDISFQLPDGLTDYIRRCWDTDPFRRPDFVDICKQIRHFRDSLLQITAFVGCEAHKLPTQGLKAVLQDPSIIDEDDFMIDITGDWSWEIDYADVVVVSDKPIRTGSGFAEVWPVRLNRCDQQMLAKHIELTLIETDDSIASFKHEMELLVRKQHRNLVSYLGATRQTPFVVLTEFANGVTLRKFSERKESTAVSSSQGDPILARRHRFREEVNLALQVACGVQFLHEGGEIPIIHGEISPDCILIDENSMTARVADFGLRSFRTAPNKWQPRWYRRAPEQHHGVALHTSMDVFSFGTILYDLFEPQKAQQFWKNKKANVLLEKGTRPTLDLASSYPRGFKSLVQRCWTHNPQERPDFETIISELEDMAGHLSRSKFFQSEAAVKDVGDGSTKR